VTTKPESLEELECHGSQFLSRRFGDVYFSKDGGVQETEYVFFAGNALAERLRSDESFSIGELGFGTGLNFFCLVDFLKDFPGSSLGFFSVEKYPLSSQEIQSAMTQNLPESCFSWFPWDAYDKARTQPRSQTWEVACPFRQIHLALWFGDVLDFLDTLQRPMDAWFVDGFSPKKNPEMWTDSVLEGIAKHSISGTSFSSFSSASFFRRKMQSLGFHVAKKKGFGRKREMSYGIYP